MQSGQPSIGQQLLLVSQGTPLQVPASTSQLAEVWQQVPLALAVKNAMDAARKMDAPSARNLFLDIFFENLSF